MMLPHTILIRDNDFHSAWSRAIKSVLREGVDLVIGDKDNPKHIKDVCAIIELYGNAISQIENHEIHKDFPFQHIDQYCNEFTREYQEQYLELEEDKKFVYTYFDRLTNYDITNMGYTRFTTDQIKVLDEYLADQIHDEISSNRDQAVTWRVDDDLGSTSPPCLQRVFIRYLGDQSVDVHLTWRSRDLFTAWQVNVIALVDMLNREVIHPNNCKIVKLVDYSDSLHIYESDISAARGVNLVPISPIKGMVD